MARPNRKPDNKPPKKGKRSLRGKGPTPKAEDRPYHKKFKSKEETQRKRTERKRIDAKRDPRRGDRKRDYRREPKDHVDTVAGRNAVVEALRAGIPAKELMPSEVIVREISAANQRIMLIPSQVATRLLKRCVLEFQLRS